MNAAAISTRVLRGFDDSTFGRMEWQRLLDTGSSHVVFLTWEWQSAWWEVFGRGELLLIVAEQGGTAVALAPLFAEAGMIYFVGSGGSDYLDFVGDLGAGEVLEALLQEARRRVQDFIGFVFYHVPDASATGGRLEAAAARLGLERFDEGGLPAPMLEMAERRDFARDCTMKQSLVRHERYFARAASFKVEHLRRSEEILPWLDEFFAQHQIRWAATATPSLFCEEAQRRFYRRLVSAVGSTGWLRFSRVEWEGRTIAFHFGFCRGGTFLWYKPSFALDLARHSPGEVLLRQLLLAALAEGARTFDFGLGDEAFKARFATRVNRVRNHGLYAPEAVPGPAV